MPYLNEMPLALRSSSIDPVAPESDQSALPVLRLKVTSPARSSNLQIDSNGNINGAASHVVSCLHTVIPKLPRGSRWLSLAGLSRHVHPGVIAVLSSRAYRFAVIVGVPLVPSSRRNIY